MASSSDLEDIADIIDRHRPETSQDSDLPAWIQAHTPVKVPIAISDDSNEATAPDRTADDATGPSAAAAAAGAGAGSSKAAAAAAAAGRSKVAATGSSKGAAAAGRSSQPSAAAAGLLPAVAVLSGAVGEAVANQIPLILPEKLIRNKVLVELEPAPHQATELSGDAGAVGRIIVDTEAAADGCFKVDLKGVLYQATVLPLAGTALVANIGPTEAKIEGVLSDFVRLREESSHLDGYTLLEGGGSYNDLMADDEDNYQLGEEGKEAAGGKAAAKKAAAAKRKAGAKGLGSKGTGKALKPAGGVKKKAAAGKKAAGAKGSETPTKPKKLKAAAAAKGKPAAAKGGKGAGGKAAAAAGKAKAPAKKSKKRESESEAKFDSDSDGGGGADSDWSMD